MSNLLLGCAMLVFAGISAWDAQRIASTVRLRGSLDLVGPDNYLIGVAALMAAVGLILVAQGIRSLRAARSVAPTCDATTEEGGHAHWVLLGTLLAYALLLPVLGYAAATVVFLAAVFSIMGERRPWRVAVGAITLTALFFVGFVGVADLPLPRGLLGL